MTSRRLLLGSALSLCAVGAKAVEALPKEKPFEEGKDFLKVVPPVKYAKEPILIHDFFSYTCPHCIKFAPLMKEFKETVTAMGGIEVVPVPVAWDEESDPFVRIYYGFEALGHLKDLHMPYWDWVINEDHVWDTVADAMKDTREWLKMNKIDLEKWDETVNSFVISGKVQTARETWKHYGVDSTPMVGIVGKFITAPHMVGNRPQTIEVIFDLLKRVGYKAK